MDALLSFIISHGYTFTPDVLDNQWHDTKCPATGEKIAYKGQVDPQNKYSLVFKLWRDTTTLYTYKDENFSSMSKAEKKKLEKEKLAKWETLSHFTTQIYNTAKRPCGKLNYLTRKGFDHDTASLYHWGTDNQGVPMLVVPLYDAASKIWNVQYTQLDGHKSFVSGAKIKNVFYSFKKETLPPLSKNIIVICEGFSTGLSVQQALGHSEHEVLCSFGTGNIKHLLELFKKQKLLKEFIVVLDNDFEKKTNAGRLVAKSIKEKYQGVKIVIPEQGDLVTGESDYNDLMQRKGLAWVREDILKQIAALRGLAPLELLPLEQSYSVDSRATAPLVGYIDNSEPTRAATNTAQINLVAPQPKPTNPNPTTQLVKPTQTEIVENVESVEIAPQAALIKVGYDDKGVYVGDIESFDAGFHTMTFAKDGTPTGQVPNYQDLKKYFDRTHHYKIVGESKSCMKWADTHYEILPDIYIEAFAQKHFFPHAKNNLIKEFKGLVLRTNIVPMEFFTTKIQRKINFLNGYLDIHTGKLKPHDKKMGFRYVLPYDYDPLANCPLFEAFLTRVTCEDSSLATLILEYFGYAISGEGCWAQKMLILLGEGANGKSTLVNIMRRVFGEANCSAVSANRFSDSNALSIMDGKLINIGEETPKKSFMESGTLKDIVTGGIVAAKKLYKDQYEVRLSTKLMLLCNELPSTWDSSAGFYRRLIIVPFNNTFNEHTVGYDPFMEHKMIPELAGILNKVVEAYKVLATNRKFSKAKLAEDTLHQYRQESDHILAWSTESIRFHALGNGHDKYYAAMQILYDNYRDYCEKSGIKSVNKIVFGKSLRRIVPEYSKRYGMFGPKIARKRGLFGVTRSNGVHWEMGTGDFSDDAGDAIPEHFSEINQVGNLEY